MGKGEGKGGKDHLPQGDPCTVVDPKLCPTVRCENISPPLFFFFFTPASGTEANEWKVIPSPSKHQKQENLCNTKQPKTQPRN